VLTYLRISVQFRRYVTATQQIAKSCEVARSCHVSTHNTWIVDRRPIALPPILWINTALILLGSLTMEVGRRHFFHEIYVMEE